MGGTGAVFEYAEAADFVLRILIGMVAGALIGIERERAKVSEAGAKELPGIRSFSLLGLFGSLSAYLSSVEGASPLFSLVFIVVFIALLVSYIVYRTIILKVGGITTYIVMTISFILGYVAGLGKLLEAVAVSILTALLLAAKFPLEHLIGGISYNELLSALELGLIFFILGPLVYASNVSVGGISLWGLYVFFTIVLTISFGSYVAVKIKGAEGLRYVALLGGLVNSEATLINLAEIYSSKGEAKLSKRNITVATILVNTAMVLRNLVLATVAAYVFLGEDTVSRVLVYVAPGLLIPGLAGFLLFTVYRETGPARTEARITSPLNFDAALRAVLAYLSLILLAWALESVMGSTSIIPVSLIGGFVNAGATILSLFTVASGSELHTLSAGVLIATMAAVLNKPLYLKSVGIEQKMVVEVAKWCVYVAIPPLVVALLLILGVT